MLFNTAPDVYDKVNLLGQQAQYDLCEGQGQPTPLSPQRIPDVSDSVATVIGQGGRRVPLLRILQTSACEKNCYYCPFRAGRRLRRTTLEPDELAAAFDQMQRKGLIEGLFLSSGIVGTVRTMDRMLATVELVRQKYQWRGYVHLKLLPNAEEAQIERAALLADRLSVNLEAPNEARLARLAPKKDFDHGLVEPLQRAWAIVRRLRNQGHAVASAGAVTQYVVGPAGESDLELLTASQRLYRQVGLRRAYYSAFSPVDDTPLQEEPPTPPLREHRLYQADFMLRQYGFNAEELPFDREGNLPHDRDPKLAWAAQHPESFPVEINRAPQRALLRVPGIGPLGAAAIVQARRSDRLRSLQDLQRLGVRSQQAAPFILFDGRAPSHQLRLFPT
ncbi:MAG TPA: radical SAM protein [Anaerolineae bacterium]|nr:radical SAM protein [Anaerolineae bacterium]